MAGRKRQKRGKEKRPKKSQSSSRATSSMNPVVEPKEKTGSGIHLNVHVTGVGQEVWQAPLEAQSQPVSEASSRPEEIHSDDVDASRPQLFDEPIRGHIQEHLDSLKRKRASWITRKLPFQKADEKGKLVRAVKLIKPTASKLSSDYLHPGLYRYLERIESIQQFAQLMNAPDDWEEQAQKVCEDEGLRGYYDEFHSSPDIESTIANYFRALATLIGFVMRKPIVCDVRKILVGGLSVLPHYAALSSTDRYAETMSGVKAFGTEFKTEKSFVDLSTFYHDSRGVRVFSAMYGYECPVFLMTNRKWKMLMINPSKDGIMTFPCGPITKDSTQLERCMATFEIRELSSERDPDQYEKDYRELLSFLVICILAAYQKPAPQTLPQRQVLKPVRAVIQEPPSLARHFSIKSSKREAPQSPTETRSAVKNRRLPQVKTVGKFPINESRDMFQEVWTMEYTPEMEREDWEFRRLAEEVEGVE